MSEEFNHMDELEQDRFEARFFGTLSAEDAKDFDAALVSDVELAQRYGTFRLAMAGLRSLKTASRSDTATLRQHLKDIDADLDRSMDAGLGTPRYRYWWAAAAAVLVVAGLSWWFSYSAGEDGQLAEQFAFQEPGLPVMMGPSQQRMDAIMNAYKQDDLATAGQLLREALVDSPDNDTLRYFKAVVSDVQGEHQAALQEFMAVPAYSVFADRAAYQVALVRLRSGDRQGSKLMLNRLRHSSDPLVADRAERLLERL